MIYASGTNFVNSLDHVAVLRTRIGAHEYGLVQTVGDQVLDPGGDVVQGDLRAAQIHLAVTRDGQNDGVVLVGILQVPGVIHLGHIHGDALLQHGRDHHENNQQHQHDVRHRNHVRRGHHGSCVYFECHDLLLSAPASDEIVDQLHGGVIHFDVEGFNPV